MTFWILSGLLTAGVALAIILTMRAPGRRGEKDDRSIYAAQLRDIDRDLARRTINTDEANDLKAEIGRRLLRADGAEIAQSSQAPLLSSILGGGFVALVLGAGSFGMYLMLGAPGYPDLPLKERIALAETARQERPSQAEREAAAPPRSVPQGESADLVAQLRITLADRQNDREGFEFLVRGEAGLGNFAAARKAMEHLIRLKGAGSTAEDYANLTDLMVLAAEGYVSQEAEDAARRALSMDPENGTARYYIGLSAIQTGRPDLGFRIWRTLLEESAPDAPWSAPIRAQILALADLAGVDYTLPDTPALRGPTAEDIEAAMERSPEERMAMIEGMVSSLSAKLANEGGSAEEWARLIRSLGVLGNTEDALAIADEARLVFAGDDRALSLIDAARQGVPQ